MILDFFGLEVDAFSLRPDLDFLFLSEAHEEAVAHLVYGLEQQEDITVIVGDIGTGKTLAIHRLLQQLSKVFVPVTVSVTTVSFEQFLGLALRKLGFTSPTGAGLGDLLFGFEEVLIKLRSKGQKVVLIVDEAQNLDQETLEGIRLLMNLAQPGPQALQLVLSGQLGLADALAQPAMRQLKQRIRVEYRLVHLNQKEVEAYIEHRLETAGRSAPLFKKEALARIFDLSAGIPRVVNHLASKAMLAAYVDGARMISAKHVEEDGVSATVLDEAPRQLELGGGKSRQTIEESRNTPADRPAPEAGETNRGLDSSPSYGHRRDSEPQRRCGRLVGWLFAVFVLVLAAIGWYLRPSWLPFLGTGEAENSAQTGVVAEPEVILEIVSTAASEEEPVLVTEPVTIPLAGEVTSNPMVDSVCDPSVSEPTADGIPTTGFVIHVASFSTMERAQILEARFEDQGYPSFIRAKEVTVGHTWYRVYIGAFGARIDAEAAVNTLTDEGEISYSLIVQLPLV